MYIVSSKKLYFNHCLPKKQEKPLHVYIFTLFKRESCLKDYNRTQ